ncbi:hypothetical protein ILUMI_21698 [Ignelater luminosus]|uniref:Regulator of telomere elongation helicase 1 homolog n=1 Tax=Ignelater luminosus TaxID=2038154 RepID=A0A8K0CF66_IGNLU|nr:hypothetical protein ILUMI_21698 [Ignelater luminosus]
MTTVTLRGIPVTFPFEPYEIQKEYMEKVIECLQNQTNGVLESPTGTGKTLSLLCASLAWITAKKAQCQAQYRTMTVGGGEDDFLKSLQEDIDQKVGTSKQSTDTYFGVPTIIYASRTHSQLAQAMQELKRTAYAHVKAVVIGSREQMCIHPEVLKEENNFAKVNMCRLKVRSKSCHFNLRVEKMKSHPCVTESPIMDIEDLISMGKSKGFCPYYMSKELKEEADVVFMPYNYLIDPRVRNTIGVELINCIVILDEAHNIERICEESASKQITSTDITLCIEEVTEVMKALTEGSILDMTDESVDFSAEDLCTLKQMLLDFEKVLDNIEVKLPLANGTTFDGDYIFEIFKKAGIGFENVVVLENTIDKVVQFLQTTQNGPFQRKGTGLETFVALLRIVFIENQDQFKAKMKKCYKVHITVEEPKRNTGNDWLSKGQFTKKVGGRVLNFWCFSPGFGMRLLMGSGVKCIILTSGTLAPLKPLISELELNVQVRLENPHIIKDNQIVVKILNKGPDGVELNSSFQNRDNPAYISSLGRTILNLSRIIPNGLLIFFPSYPIMQKCQLQWQEEGLWGNISDQKAIYVEPKQKEAFTAAMNEYYARIQNPEYKGAIFMGVCRGKISEGLDFADMNGRAVILTGLPYPPLKDPKIVLKRQYLDICRVDDREFLSGDDWYSLEATRAVNQAMGRVIRHRYDYGAIILLDSRFSYGRIRSNLSLWLRERIRLANNFGEAIRDLRDFFRFADANLPAPKAKSRITTVNTTPAEFEATGTYSRRGNFDFSTSSACSSINDSSASSSSSSNTVKIYSRDSNNGGVKRKRITIVSANNSPQKSGPKETDIQQYIAVVRNTLEAQDFKAFVAALKQYRDTENFDDLISQLDKIFLLKFSVRYVIQGLSPYIREQHKSDFGKYWERMR